MAPTRATKESASEIARRYNLEELSGVRGFARRYYINSLASKAFSLIYDTVPVDEELDTSFLPRYLRYGNHRRPLHYLRDFPVLPRRNLPTVAARMLYDRRLAEQAAERREALRKADSIMSRYYLDHDPMALLDVPDEELDLDNADDDNTNEGGPTNDKRDATGAKDKTASADTSASLNEQHPALPDSRHSRRLRYPRLSAEAIYRILEAGI